MSNERKQRQTKTESKHGRLSGVEDIERREEESKGRKN